MKHIKHWLATMAVLLCSITASARDFYADGFYYNITSSTEVCVTYEGYDAEASDEYRSENIIIPSTVLYNGKTYTVTAIGDEAFGYCENLTSITIPESVTRIGGSAFGNCEGLTSVFIPKNVDWIDSSPFAGCTNLKTIIVDEDNTKYDSRDGCNAIIRTKTNVLLAACAATVIPESVTYIGGRSFRSCKALTTFIVPKNVTGIGHNAFQDCENLTSIYIHMDVDDFGDSIFQGCKSLTDVYYYTFEIPLHCAYAIDDFNAENATLHVPAGMVDKFKADVVWGKFGNIVPLTEEEKGIFSVNG